MEAGTGRRARTREGAWLGVAALLAASITALAPEAMAQGTDPKALLKAMSTYVGGLKTIELTLDSDIEVITPQLEKIQFSSSSEVLLSRPDKLRAHRRSGHAEVTAFFDGRTYTVESRVLAGYAQIEAPGSLDQLIEILREGYGVSLPAADLLKSNSYDLLVAGVQEAKYIGRGIVDGVNCEHLAFRNFDTDWQLWVEVGDRPFPRKMVITTKTMNSAPQYTLRVKSWKAGVAPAPGAFTFVPPAGAKKLDPNSLLDLDELPQGAPAGGKS